MEKRGNQWKDRLGIFASVACAIHCAATPLLLACLPALTFTQWMASPRFHQTAALLCVAIVSLTIWPAFVKFRDYRVLSLSLVGLTMLISAAFVLPDECCSRSLAATNLQATNDAPSVASETRLRNADAGPFSLASLVSPELLSLVQPWMTPLGGLLLVVAHGFNLRCRVRRSDRRSEACDYHRTAQTNLATPITMSEPADRLVVGATTQAA